MKKKPGKRKRNYTAKQMAEALCNALRIEITEVQTVHLYKEKSVSGEVFWRIRTTSEIED